MTEMSDVMTGTYDIRLVTLSVVIAVLAAYSLLGVAERMLASRGRMASVWVVGGAGSMGFGIWSMHFVGMLALQMPISLTYDARLTLLSIVPAAAGSAILLDTIRRHRPLTSTGHVLASVALGGGIGAMHYTGMAAVDVTPGIRYSPVLLLLSVLVAVVLSAIGVRLAARVVGARYDWIRRLPAAGVIGVAVAAMHYVGMRATHIGVHSVSAVGGTSMSPATMALAVSMAALIVLGCTVLVSWFDAAREASPRARHQKSLAMARVLVAGLLCLGGVATAAGTVWLRNLAATVEAERLEREAQRVATEVESRFHRYDDYARSLAAVFAGAPTSFRAEFSRNVEQHVRADSLQALIATGIIEPSARVSSRRQSNTGRAVQATRTDTLDGRAATRFILSEIYPVNAFRRLEGTALVVDDSVREAIFGAVKSGTPVLAHGPRPVLTRADGGSQLWYMLPVYEARLHARTPTDRVRALAGFLHLRIDYPRLLDEAARAANSALLFRWTTGANGAVDAPAPSPVGMSHERVVSLAGLRLTFRASETAAFRAGIDRSAAAAFATGGAALTLLIGFVTWIIARDRAGSRSAFAALAQKHERLAKVAQYTSDAVLIADAERRTVWVNEGYTRVTGYTPEESVGRTLDDLVQCESMDPAAARAMRARLDADAVFCGEMRNRTKDGREYWLEIEIQPVHDASGTASGFIAVQSDITEKKDQERSLREATERAQAASAAKGQFLANMSHEIRTPMNAILGMLKLLQNTELTTRQLDYATKTEGAALSLLRLLNDILDYSKVEAGKVTLDPHPFRLDRMFRDLSVIMSANVGDKDVEVLFDIDADVPGELIGDATRLQQVLINLGGNAIKFTEHGEVVVRVRVIDRVAETVTLAFSVRDSGIGIAPEHQLDVFSGFSQAEASTTRRFGGTGLGLSICRRLVALMGGELQLSSAAGAGSTFSFTLALSVAAEHRDRGTSPSTSIPGLHALIVDDNPTARTLLGSMIESLGWHATLAASGAEALAHMTSSMTTSWPVQAVFVDWQMPDMDGWETSVRIRQLTAAEPAPLVVMVTAHGREMLAQRSEYDQALLNGFLVKPVTASMLFDAIADARVALVHPLMRHRTPRDVSRRLIGMHVLLVEDNTINQQVAKELLEDEGAVVRIAANGREGVEAIETVTTPFDVVLMDLQMPVMDGFAATTEIRERLGLRQLPIVAMTANAMTSDRDACLACGMDDHLGKPFDLDELVALLLRYSTPDAPAPGKGRSSPVAENADLRIDAGLLAAGGLPETLAPFDLPAALRRVNRKAGLLRKLLVDFHGKYEGAVGLLRQHVARGDRKDAQLLAHTIKGIAGTLEASRLAAAASAVERALREQQADGMTPLVDALETELQIAVAACTRLVAGSPRGASAPAQAPAAATVQIARRVNPDHVASLQSALSTQNLSARSHFDTLRAVLGGAGVEPHLDRMSQQLGSLDFEGASATLERMLDAMSGTTVGL